MDGQRLQSILSHFPDLTILVVGDFFLDKYLDVDPLIAETSVETGKMAHQVTAEERRRLLGWLKDFRLEVTGHRPFSEAIITAGGVDTKEIDPRTMESRIVKGLYFAGEVLDLDADTGGYNLQAAFSTGWLAGRSAATHA